MRYNFTSIILHPSQLLKVFNDATNTLSGIYYSTTKLFMIETLNIVGTLYDCISQDEDLKSCILVMKSKWCSYYSNIYTINLFIRINF